MRKVRKVRVHGEGPHHDILDLHTQKKLSAAASAVSGREYFIEWVHAQHLAKQERQGCKGGKQSPTFEMVLFSAAYDSSISRMENSGVTFVRKGSP